MIGKGYEDNHLTEAEIHELMAQTFNAHNLSGKRVLIIIPDTTRTAPIPQMFRLFYDFLGNKAAALDYLIALGTHQPLNEEAINKHIGVTPQERTEKYANINIFNTI